MPPLTARFNSDRLLTLMLFHLRLIHSFHCSTPLPPHPPLRHTVYLLFVRFGLLPPLSLLVSRLNKTHGHAKCRPTHVHALLHSNDKNCNIQIQISIDMQVQTFINTSRLCNSTNSSLYLAGKSWQFCVFTT